MGTSAGVLPRESRPLNRPLSLGADEDGFAPPPPATLGEMDLILTP